MNIIINPEFEALIPPLSTEERAQLEQNLITDGCRDPLVVWRAQGADQERDIVGTCVLIDGHNRFAICKKHDLEYEVDEMEFASATDAKVWMIDNQRGRRNLTDGWRYELSQTRKAMLAEKGNANKAHGLTAPGKSLLSTIDKSVTHNTQKEIAAELGWSTGKVAMADLVWKKAEPEVKEQIKAGDVSINQAYKEIVNQEKRETRAELIKKQRDDIEQGIIDLPVGVFEVIAIDPPWNYGREYDPDGSRVANPYPEMTQAQLLEINPPFAEDAVLFLWTTHQFLFDARELLNKWGFTYKANIVWDKERIGIGAWVRMQCEFCLVGIKGKPTWENTTWRDIIRESRREHSRKPDAFYKMVEEVTVGRRLEYFSREQRKGWEVFGNDTAKF